MKTTDIWTIIKGSKGKTKLPEDVYINPNTLEQDRIQIDNDLTAKYGSREKGIKEAQISSAQMCDFMKGKKGLGRDAQIRLYLSLGYSYEYANTLLHRFNQKDLYPKDKRDFEIIQAFENHLTVDELDELLIGEGLDGICRTN